MNIPSDYFYGIPSLFLCIAFMLGCVCLTISQKRLTHLYIGLSMVGLCMACYGLLQFLECLPGHHALYKVTGIFDNPTGIGMFLAMLLPYALFLNTQNCWFVWLKRFSIGLFVFVLLASDSRTGALAAICATMVMYRNTLSKQQIKILTVIGSCLLIGLYFYKPLSAQGRLLITWICIRLTDGHFWLGHGWYGFETEYMLEQAAFFQEHPDKDWIMIADDIRRPFNEYLHFFIRFGMLGMLILFSVTVWFYHYAHRHYILQKLPAVASLCAGLVCGCFSYPSYYLLLNVLMAINLGVLLAPSNSKTTKTSNTLKCILVAAMAGFFITFTYQSHYECKRMELEERAQNGENSTELMREFQKLASEPYFRQHSAFLYDYALYLYECQQYKSSLKWLKQSLLCRQDYEWQMRYAYTLLQLDNYQAAIKAFRLASDMVPIRIQPRYELIGLYKRLGELDKAYICAKEALGVPIKVHNLKTNYIRAEIENMMLNLQKQKGGVPHGKN